MGTIRDNLNSWQERWAAGQGLTLVGWLIAVAVSACFLGLWAFTACLVLLATWTIYAHRRWWSDNPCPKCGVSLNPLISDGQVKGMYMLHKVKENVKFCPGCGLSLDCEVATLEMQTGGGPGNVAEGEAPPQI